MIKTIIIIILGIIIGILVAFPISKFFIKKHKKKIAKDSSEKILKQKQTNLQTSSGKPVNLNFKNDGKDVDLKKQVLGELAEAKVKEIKGYKEKVKEIKGHKEKIKVSGSFKKKTKIKKSKKKVKKKKPIKRRGKK